MASKNSPTAILSGVGWLTQFASGVLKGLADRGWTDEDIHSLVTDKGLARMGLCIDGFVAAFRRTFVSSYDSLTGSFAWEVDYDESLSGKFEDRDTGTIHRVTGHATDENFPDNRTRKRLVTGKIIFLPSDSLESLRLQIASRGLVFARPKELIDFARAFPSPMLDDQLPIVAAGQFSIGGNLLLYLSRHCKERALDFVVVGPKNNLQGLWRFLVLDK